MNDTNIELNKKQIKRNDYAVRSEQMKRMLTNKDKNVLRIWAVMVQESRNFNAFNSVIIRPRSIE